MIRIIVVILLAVVGSAHAQTKYEQIVLEHFFDNVFKEKYQNVTTIEFNGCTVDELSNFSLFKNCFDLDKEIIAALDKKAFGNTFSIKKVDLSRVESITFKKKKVKSKMKMYLYQANQINDSYYVILGIVKPKHFSDNYYYELDEFGKVIRWCESGMIE